MKKELMFGFGTAMIIWGITLLGQRFLLTGFSISERFAGEFVPTIGVVLIALGIGVIVVSRLAFGTDSLETRVRTHDSVSDRPHVMISKIALEKLKKDKTIRGMKSKYEKEIEMIRSNPGQRPQEVIGDFRVSPLGNKSIRVAWHHKGDTIYVDDFLYHANTYRYADNWNHGAAVGKITKDRYQKEGYLPLEETNFA